jgi:hypothetical protein
VHKPHNPILTLPPLFPDIFPKLLQPQNQLLQRIDADKDKSEETELSDRSNEKPVVVFENCVNDLFFKSSRIPAQKTLDQGLTNKASQTRSKTVAAK